MADLDSIEEARRKAEAEAQRVQAANYAQGQVIGSTGPTAPSVSALNRPVAEFGTPAVPTPEQSVRAADYSERGLPTTSEAPAPGTSRQNPLVGTPLSQDEQNFWAANPMGAVLGPDGNLVGLGSTPAQRYGQIGQSADAGLRQTARNEILSGYGQDVASQGRAFDVMGQYGLTEPGSERPGTQPVPNFVHVPEIDPNVIAQRGNIQREIAATMRDLQVASTVRPGRGQPSQREILSQKLNQLQDANSSLGLEHYRQSEMQRKASDQNAKLQDKYRIDQDVVGIQNAVTNLKSRPGDPQFQDDLIKIRSQYPYALKDANTKAKLMQLAKDHVEEAAFNDRVNAAKNSGRTLTQTGISSTTGRPTFKLEPTLDEAASRSGRQEVAKALAESGVSQDQFAQRTKEERGTLDEKTGKFTPSSDGTHIRVTTADNSQFAIPAGTYNLMNTAIPATRAQGQVAPASGATSQPKQVKQNGVIYTLQPDGSYK